MALLRSSLSVGVFLFEVDLRDLLDDFCTFERAGVLHDGSLLGGPKKGMGRESNLFLDERRGVEPSLEESSIM
jgi:hypothetical protein